MRATKKSNETQRAWLAKCPGPGREPGLGPVPPAFLGPPTLSPFPVLFGCGFKQPCNLVYSAA